MAEQDEPEGSPPSYEPIGAGSDGGFDDDGSEAPEGMVAAAFRRGMRDGLQSMRSARFWVGAVFVLLACWGAGVVLVIAAVTGGTYPPDVHDQGYILAAAMLTLAAAMVAVRWGLAPVPGSPGQQRDDGGPLRGWFAAVFRGVVFAALAGGIQPRRGLRPARR